MGPHKQKRSQQRRQQQPPHKLQGATLFETSTISKPSSPNPVNISNHSQHLIPTNRYHNHNRLRPDRINVRTSLNRRFNINTSISSTTTVRRRSTINTRRNNRTVNSRSHHPTHRRPIRNLLRRHLTLHIRHQNNLIRRRRQNILRRHPHSHSTLLLPPQRTRTTLTRVNHVNFQLLTRRTIHLYDTHHHLSLNFTYTLTTRNSILTHHHTRSSKILQRRHSHTTRPERQRLTSVITIRRSTTLLKVRRPHRRLRRNTLTNAKQTSRNRNLTQFSHRHSTIRNQNVKPQQMVRTRILSTSLSPNPQN